jgi:hypothetical protein
MILRWLSSNMNLRLRFVLPITASVIVCMAVLSAYLINRQADSFQRELQTTARRLLKFWR